MRPAAPGAVQAPGQAPLPPAVNQGQQRAMVTKGERVPIAVTKFANVAGRADYEWLGLAISETLSSKLSASVAW